MWVGLVKREADRMDEIIQRKSRIHIIIRSVAYVFRFIQNARQSHHKRRKCELSSDEVNSAHTFLIRRVQNNVYQQEVEDLRASRPISMDSTLIKLIPYLSLHYQSLVVQ